MEREKIIEKLKKIKLFKDGVRVYAEDFTDEELKKNAKIIFSIEDSFNAALKDRVGIKIERIK